MRWIESETNRETKGLLIRGCDVSPGCCGGWWEGRACLSPCEYSTSNGANSRRAAVTAEKKKPVSSPLDEWWLLDAGGEEEEEREEVEMGGGVAHGLLPWQWVPCQPTGHKLIPVFLTIWPENSSLLLSLAPLSCSTLSFPTSHPLCDADLCCQIIRAKMLWDLLFTVCWQWANA